MTSAGASGDLVPYQAGKVSQTRVLSDGLILSKTPRRKGGPGGDSGWPYPAESATMQDMGLDPFESALILVGVAGALILLWLGRPALLSGGRGLLPRSFQVVELGGVQVPLDVRQPLAYLSERLGRLGFTPADLPVRVPAVSGWGRHLLLVPFVHEAERALFIMGIESRLVGSSQIMLHILTPLAGSRRVETTTLAGLDEVIRPPGVEVEVALDANTVEEIWSRHRLALNRYERAARATVAPTEWRGLAALAYEAWLQSALRSNRLELDPSGEAYRIHRARNSFRV